MDKFENGIITILKYLWDIETGVECLEKDTGFGVSGKLLFEKIGVPLTPHEFIAQLKYLEDKGMIERKPDRMPRTRTKEEELQLAFYSITSIGIDIVEGKIEDPELRNILQVIKVGDISSDHSQITIGAVDSVIDVKIEHSQSDDIQKLLSELCESLKEIHSQATVDSATKLINIMKMELSNPEPDQDLSVVESTLKRLKRKLDPYKNALFILGSLASILGIVL
jgi:hypothetical protein